MYTMAAAPVALLVFLLCTATAAAPDSSGNVSPLRLPHLTGCVSSNMETFHCGWNVGTFQNLSEPGALRLFYISKNPRNPPNLSAERRECPLYPPHRPNKCFFSENHTSIWTFYSIQLCSADQTTVYDENVFLVEDIVQPDPPVSLNWTLLNMSITGHFYDIMLSWDPPPSADVATGWMTLQYEVQHRSVTSDRWHVVELVKTTRRSLYGLQVNITHQVRVRCKTKNANAFGGFSESLFVHVSSKESTFPMVSLLVFGILCVVAVLMLALISQQEKLMFIFLPPVPGPKIRGIDPDLLKNGKLQELVSSLPPPLDLRPELYSSDPWVEFIDLDIEEQNVRLADLDTDCLSERCSLLSAGFREDDSGHASCCDPDCSSVPDTSPSRPLLPNQIFRPDPPIPGSHPERLPERREVTYTQVSEVRASGRVLLSPEEQPDDKEPAGSKLGGHGGYTSALSASIGNQDQLWTAADGTFVSVNPALAYTVVEGVDGQNSLFLTVVPQLIPPKTAPPGSYLTPDLLGSLTQ